MMAKPGVPPRQVAAASICRAARGRSRIARWHRQAWRGFDSLDTAV